MNGAGGMGAGVRRCSACGRAGTQVKTLLPGRVQGSQVVICDRCVRECEQTIADAPTRIPGGAHACAYCTKLEEHVAVIVGVGAKKICDECVDAYRAALG